MIIAIIIYNIYIIIYNNDIIIIAITTMIIIVIIIKIIIINIYTVFSCVHILRKCLLITITIVTIDS